MGEERVETASENRRAGFVRGVAGAFGRAWRDVRHGRTPTRLLGTAAVLGALSTYVLTMLVAGRAAVPWLPELPWDITAGWRPIGEQLARLLHAEAFDYPGMPFLAFPGQRGKISVALVVLIAGLWAARAHLSRDARREAVPLGAVLAALTLAIVVYTGAAWGTGFFAPGHALQSYLWLYLAPGVAWDVADAAAGAVAAGMLAAGTTSTTLARMLEAAAPHFRRLFVLYLALLLALRVIDAAPTALLHLGWADLRGATALQDLAPAVRVAATALLAFAPAAVIADGAAPRRAAARSLRLWRTRAGVAGAAILLLWMAGRTGLSLLDRSMPPSVAGAAVVLFLTLELQAWALLATLGVYRSFGVEPSKAFAPARGAVALHPRA